jgi:very-short-patch-repair endonuclease/transcription elongation GreA/GreB family factor
VLIWIGRGARRVTRPVRERLVGLLDYVEQVVRLDERVAMRLADYRLFDGSNIAITDSDTQNLPGVRHDLRTQDFPVWLEIERLARRGPPLPPENIAAWIVIPADPAKQPEILTDRIITVSAAERDEAIAKGNVRSENIMEAPRLKGEPANAPPKFDLRIKLLDYPDSKKAIDSWVAGPWRIWAAEEGPRRRTISLYQRLYKALQIVESVGGESSVEIVWGIGVVNWQKDGRIIDRPLLECRVEIEIDDKKGGLIRIRPSAVDASFDLKPYEELGCEGLPLLAELIRKEILRAAEDEGISPFARDSFEPILTAAAARLDRDGYYSPDIPASQSGTPDLSRLVVTPKWVLFARPRSQHIVLQDIDRLRKAAEKNENIGRVSERLVTEPSRVTAGAGWAPLGGQLGSTLNQQPSQQEQAAITDVFFPKPYNDDQIEIVQRLLRSDGLVVQGPPGTGKTHTIANIICHAMATGLRVLVVSRGEAALAVLRDHLPEEVRSLAIAILTNERQGLRQIEGAVREVQSVVDGTRPAVRVSAIQHLESEIIALKQRIDGIDSELEKIANAHLSKIGPRHESPADLARRIASSRDNYAWFLDRPTRFASETNLTDTGLQALANARQQAGNLIDHSDARLPSPHDLPSADEVAGWHADLIRSKEFAEEAKSLRIDAVNCKIADQVADALDALSEAARIVALSTWMAPFWRGVLERRSDAWLNALRERIAEWISLEKDQASQAGRVIQIPEALLEDDEARAAIARGAAGGRLWPILSVGKGNSKALVAEVTLDGKSISDDDVYNWRFIASRIAFIDRSGKIAARWSNFLVEIGANVTDDKRAREEVQKILRADRGLEIIISHIGKIVPGHNSIDTLARHPDKTVGLAKQIRSASAAARLAVVSKDIERVSALFAGGDDRTSAAVRKLVDEVIGKSNVEPERIALLWLNLLKRCERVHSLSQTFIAIKDISFAISNAGAPIWAEQLRKQVFGSQEIDVALNGGWRDAWDFAAADAHLAKIDARDRLHDLNSERAQADARRHKLFGELVRERTFYELERRLSSSVKAALVEFVRALARIGKGTGKGAGANRRTARDALGRCYNAIPCWIMPTWRVAEQLPPELGSIDLVIIDEASQSDVTELPALLRGKKVLVVGDDRQVSPTAPFVTQAKVQQLRHHYLRDVPFGSLLEPGESLYDLMRAVFPDERLMLKEHFRCVEPIIQFSMQFYPEKMLPLRVPTASERLDPPLVDIYVPFGRREARKKINTAEAQVIVDEISAIIANSKTKHRSIGVISLIGMEQAEYIRSLLSERIGEELMQKHSILCGDSAAFQGNERDIVLLSMVADPQHRTALTMLRYEQRFNVAASRGRDRLILVRSVRREELNPADLKARLIAHFENPMPAERIVGDDIFADCESQFERDVLKDIIERGYRVQAQVGSLGYRIDIVVEGDEGKRLAVECDGDRFHGPEQWRDDMRRQRVLERVGWKFWRCFASSYYRARNETIADLIEMLNRMGIQPVGKSDSKIALRRYTEHRTVERKVEAPMSVAAQEFKTAEPIQSGGIRTGDRVIILFSDDGKRLAVRLTKGADDLENGLLSINSQFGRVICGADEGDEVEVEISGQKRKALIESVERMPVYDKAPGLEPRPLAL